MKQFGQTVSFCHLSILQGYPILPTGALVRFPNPLAFGSQAKTLSKVHVLSN